MVQTSAPSFDQLVRGVPHHPPLCMVLSDNWIQSPLLSPSRSFEASPLVQLGSGACPDEGGHVRLK